VVVVEGDAVGDKKGDARAVEAAVARAEAAAASQIILVSTASSSGGGGGLFSFGGGGKTPNKSLTRTEQAVRHHVPSIGWLFFKTIMSCTTWYMWWQS
jgi:hypothetical protein